MASGVFGGQCIDRHTAFIFDRGGMQRLGQILDVSSVSWARDRDSTTEATVRVEGNACQEQASFISSIRSHRHELVIFRGLKRVWEGPIHRISWHGDFTEIVAHDVSEYLFHTPLTQAYDNRYPNIIEVSTRIGDILTYELTHGRTMQKGDATVVIPAWESINPPINVEPYLDIRHFPNEARTAAFTTPYQMTAGEHLANLARYSGIDWTTVGRSIIVWDTSRSLGRIQQLTESDFIADIVVTEYGSDHRQAGYVIGQDGVYGGAVNTNHLDYYGPWTDITTSFDEEGGDAPTTAELTSQAERNIAGRSPAPLEVRIPDNSSLLLSETLTINDLVPGVVVPLRAKLNARQVTQTQRIDIVRVSENSEGETVQLTMTPTTRPDSDVET